MKKLFLILLPLLLISCATTLPPAGPTNEMIDGADKILLNVEETAEEAYQHFAQHLSDYGFGFENTDKDLMIIKTDIQDYGNALNSYAFSMNISISSRYKTTIQVTGNGNMGIGTDFEVENKKSLGSNVKLMWEKMHEIVSSYPHQEISYARN
ncbi:MAG: hypothetical protein WD059_07945 [Balneolaceae bacterium]